MDDVERASRRGQASGFLAALVILGLLLGAWFLVGGKILFTKKNDGFGATMIVLP